MRTPESIRAAAAEQFAACVEFDTRCERDATQALSDQDLGMRIVEAALVLPAGGALSLSEHFPPGTPPDVIYGQSFRVLPYLCGALRLLDMTFVHETVGLVPLDVVRDLFAGKESVMHEGVELTGRNVHLQYARRAESDVPA